MGHFLSRLEKSNEYLIQRCVTGCVPRFATFAPTCVPRGPTAARRSAAQVGHNEACSLTSLLSLIDDSHWRAACLVYFLAFLLFPPRHRARRAERHCRVNTHACQRNLLAWLRPCTCFSALSRSFTFLCAKSRSPKDNLGFHDILAHPPDVDYRSDNVYHVYK